MTAFGKVQCGATIINYCVEESDTRKTVALSVSQHKNVKVIVPKGLEKEKIQQIVQGKVAWILKKFAWFDRIPSITINRQYKNGETFQYLGRQYRLKIILGAKQSAAKLVGRYLEISVPDRYCNEKLTDHIKRKVSRWYAKHAKQKFNNKILEFSKKFNILIPTFQVKNLKKRWGSCSSRDYLTLNYRIIMAPMSQVEYVLMHELCHIFCKNHSVKFWEQLRLAMPDYAMRQENLKRDGWGYVL
jgi:hypothetical protein